MDEQEELARLREAVDAVAGLDLDGPAAAAAVEELERIAEALTDLLGRVALGAGPPDAAEEAGQPRLL